MNTLQEKFPEFTGLDDKTKKAISLYKKIAEEANREGWFIVFLSGFAFDAHIGHITRNHKDCDVMISKKEAPHLQKFLQEEGHDVYEPERIKGEGLKVDNSEAEKPMRAYCDIHFFGNDENGLATIPLLGKELKFSKNSSDIYDELLFLGVRTKFLKPEFLLEEKIGWQEQVGLTKRDDEDSEREKIRILIDSHTP